MLKRNRITVWILDPKNENNIFTKYNTLTKLSFFLLINSIIGINLDIKEFRIKTVLITIGVLLFIRILKEGFILIKNLNEVDQET